LTFGAIGENEPKCDAIGTSLEIPPEARRITLQFNTFGVDLLSMLELEKRLPVTEDVSHRDTLC
jgi:hypothetical protein